jgi:hypothetical protein
MLFLLRRIAGIHGGNSGAYFSRAKLVVECPTVSVDPRAPLTDTSAMSSIAEIEAAIEQLSPAEVSQLAAWLEARRQQMFSAMAKPARNGNAATTRGGVPLLPSRGEVITPEKVRRLMEQEGI